MPIFDNENIAAPYKVTGLVTSIADIWFVGMSAALCDMANLDGVSV
jgi:hypothetical protein